MTEAIAAFCIAFGLFLLPMPAVLLVGLRGHDAWELSEHRRDLLGDRCLRCGGNVVADVAGHYRCKACGFDTAALGDLWESLAELRSGMSMVREARFHVKRAARYARWNRFGLVHSNFKYRELEEATRLMMEAHDLLRDLSKTWPELLELPDPQEMVDPHDAASDLETGNVLGVVLQLGLRARIAANLDRGLRRLDEGIAVVEGLVGGLTE